MRKRKRRRRRKKRRRRGGAANQKRVREMNGSGNGWFSGGSVCVVERADGEMRDG